MSYFIERIKSKDSIAMVLALAIAVFLSASSEGPKSFDVIIYGATPAGITSAISVVNEGGTVAIVDPLNHLGGMTTAGLGNTDVGNKSIVGGLTKDFHDRIGKHYKKRTVWRFEPHVATKVFKEMIAEKNIPIFYQHKLTSVTKNKNKITKLSTDNGEFLAKAFIDASYEGDLLAAAGVEYRIGRESRKEFNESFAGVFLDNSFHKWPIKIPAIDENGEIYPGVSPTTVAEPGSGDKKVQAYNFRLCMTSDPKRKVKKIVKPKNYNRKDYILLEKLLTHKPGMRIRHLFYYAPLPNNKFDYNNKGPFSSDLLGGSLDYVEADWDKRLEIWQKHKDYTQGLVYFLTYDKAVPERLRKKFLKFTYCNDEWVETDNWPPQLYVREARRMVSNYFMTERDILDSKGFADSIATVASSVDIHYVDRNIDKDGYIINDGYARSKTHDFEIPYRSIVPKEEQASNLIVPVCVSSTHVAYSAVRMEPIYMTLGEIAGKAAMRSVEKGISVQQVPLQWLR